MAEMTLAMLKPEVMRLKIIEDCPNCTPLKEGDVVTHEEGKFLGIYAVVLGHGLTWFVERHFLRRVFKNERD